VTSAIPSTMRAAVLYAKGDLRIEERPVPAYGPDEVLLRVRSVGVCGSDVHYYTEGRIGDVVVNAPTVLGHEAAGEVAAVGAEVRDFAVGDRVAVEPSLTCGVCAWCRSGRYNVCPAVKHLGTPPVDGIYQTYFATPTRRLFVAPPTLSFDEIALLEPLSVGLHAVTLAPTCPGDVVVVLGAGPIGLMTLQMVRLSGASRIIATDKLDSRLAVARSLGATDTVNAAQTDARSAVLDLTGGRGADVVYEAAGAPETFQQALDVAAPCAAVALIGIYAAGASSLDLHGARRKELTIRMVRRFRHAFPRALDLAARGKVELAALATHRFRLADTEKAFTLVQTYGDGVIRAVINP
jgi:L-iditol 2-dehydrogenase